MSDMLSSAHDFSHLCKIMVSVSFVIILSFFWPISSSPTVGVLKFFILFVKETIWYSIVSFF